VVVSVFGIKAGDFCSSDGFTVGAVTLAGIAEKRLKIFYVIIMI
jgi:hypothetical protein